MDLGADDACYDAVWAALAASCQEDLSTSGCSSGCKAALAAVPGMTRHCWDSIDWVVKEMFESTVGIM